MKRFFGVAILAVFVFFFAVFAGQAAAKSGEESIQSYDVEATIGEDATVSFTETIVYNFDGLERHGIIRTIPVTKTNAQDKKFALDITIVSVTDPGGKTYRYTTTREGDALQVKIGDPDKTITGQHIYVIRYTAAGALTYFPEHDELYWNAIGTEWDVPVAKGTTRVTIPQAFADPDVHVACFTGPTGATESDCPTGYKDGVATVTPARELSANEGLTVVVGFPKGAVAVVEPKEVVPFFSTFFGRIVAGILFVLGFIWYTLVPLWIIWYWWKNGRDPKPAMGVTSAWFSPPKNSKHRPLTPIETGALIDETVDMRDIFATIVDLARRGYMKITEKEKNTFTLTKTKEWKEDAELLSFEKELLKGIFESKDMVKLGDVNLVSTVSKVSGQVYESLVADGFFPKNPQSVRTVYYVIAGIAFFTFNLFLALIAVLVGRHIPRKTPMGAQEAAVAKSLKNFLVSQDRHLKFQAQNQMFFEKLLPYAVAFGVEKIWAERFAKIKMTPPDWYEPYHSGTFNSAVFARSLGAGYSHGFASSASYKSSSGFSSGFSGGGSSGGGGGGGGGGSW